ncbi:hypothetical protein DEO72_LG2g3415 [Vigna unguiculata]|uniref:Uncharacterized protein n=1 Tax=Vigna unguiculata TaxID=3917 RepID=A0A4D6L3J3_VIGUN|nr:hypothetical protein DEO72_LG2g3415 [Vigna unguiculata]
MTRGNLDAWVIAIVGELWRATMRDGETTRGMALNYVCGSMAALMATILVAWRSPGRGDQNGVVIGQI